ncbi:MAG TPA: hypothetical protein VLJ68_12990, partial [Chitinophagaceae bacterium]|nr:hypothetical protein [Chitinophagaceae bacterium]
MKKTLFSIIVAGVAVLVSCSKGSSPIPPPPATPTLNIGLSPETVWYNEASTIIWSTANTDSVQVNGVKVNGNSLLTPLLTADTTYTFKAFGPGGSLTRTVTVFVCSQKTTLLSNYGNWKNVYSVSYKQTDALN